MEHILVEVNPNNIFHPDDHCGWSWDTEDRFEVCINCYMLKATCIKDHVESGPCKSSAYYYKSDKYTWFSDGKNTTEYLTCSEELIKQIL
jgi:hypothetical protein